MNLLFPILILRDKLLVLLGLLNITGQIVIGQLPCTLVLKEDRPRIVLVILLILIDGIPLEFSYRIHVLIHFYRQLILILPRLTSAVTRARVNVALTFLQDLGRQRLVHI